MNIPASNLETFQDMLNNPNNSFEVHDQQNTKVVKVKKNLVLSHVSDSTGCGHIRNVFPMTYLNAIFGKSGRFNLILSPAMIYQDDILRTARTIFFQRTMSPHQIPQIRRYKEIQKQFGYKMVYDIDDFIWRGPDAGEHIPPYNFGSLRIGDDVRAASLEIMNMMDTVCVSTEFLGNYIKEHGVNSEIKVVPNSVPRYMWEPDNGRKKPITSKIVKPRVLYSGSPTHYCNKRKMPGDWENAWQEWVIKAVKDDKIEFLCMGGLPYFFKPIEKKVKWVKWVSSYQFHLPIKEFKPDFGLAPLVPNYFNYSKSFIKYQEYCAVGAVGIGTYFTNGKPSPYDINVVKTPDNITVEQIDDLFDKLCEPNLYNRIIAKQYKQMDENGWYLESEKYIKMLTDIF